MAKSLLLAKSFLAVSSHGGRQKGKRAFTYTIRTRVREKFKGEIEEMGSDSSFYQEPMAMATA